MYKLIIADDERTILDGLANHINWEQMGFEIVGVFSDGEEVIECLDSMPVDVVLTDIMMNHCNGIEIARYVKESELPCTVVFISGHKDFELALQAIKYDVEDYITKPTKVEEVTAVFNKIREKLDQQARDLEFQKKHEAHWDELYPVLMDQFVNSLVMGTLDDKKSVIQRMHFLCPGIEVERCPCCLANIEIAEYDEFIKTGWNYEASQFDDALYGFVRSLRNFGWFHVIYKSKGKIKLFILMNEFKDTNTENHLLCTERLNLFAERFIKQFGIPVTVKMECIFENALEVLKQHGRLNSNKCCREDVELHLYELKKLLLTNLLCNKINAAQKVMNSILQNLQGNDVRYIMNFVVDVFSCISELLREKNYPMYQAILPFIDYCGIANLTSFSDVSAYCNRVFELMKSENGMLDHMEKEDLIKRFKAYVQEHIYEDNTLDDAANELFISTTHLSRIIKKQMGETYLQYVTRKKMEKAVELLHDPTYRVYQISEKLGYKTTRYFSKLFYNFSGYNPTQYRKEILLMRDTESEE